jgi:hypothetical protein
VLKSADAEFEHRCKNWVANCAVSACSVLPFEFDRMSCGLAPADMVEKRIMILRVPTLRRYGSLLATNLQTLRW